MIKYSYLALSLLSFGILTARFTLPDAMYDVLYASYPYCVILITAIQILWMASNGGHDDDNTGKFIHSRFISWHGLKSGQLQAHEERL